MNKSDIYIQNFVWRRISDSVAIRYAVLMHVESGKFAVQSADFFDRDGETHFERFDQQFVELMMELSPLERCDWHNSIADAIQAHDIDFSN